MEQVVTRPSVAIVGRGRLGSALAGALASVGWPIDEPYGRGADPRHADVVVLCVPDREIEVAAAALTRRDGLLVGHCSGAVTLDALVPHEAFGLHPLMTVPGGVAPRFGGATAAVAGTTPRALGTAILLAESLDMVPVEVRDVDRAAYHAAASVASNFLVVLEDLAERVAASAGVSRERLVPLVRAAVDNWAEMGADALTGPVARGDRETVARQRAAIAERCGTDLGLFDALVAATHRLSERGTSS